MRRSGLEWSDGAAGPLLRLLADVTGSPLAWMDSAACAEVDPDLHFPLKGGSTGAAKRICQGCLSREPCLEYALEHNIRDGIWGMTSERERRRIKAGRNQRRQEEAA